MTEPERFLVGVHFRRHLGGPGRLTIAHDSVVLTDRRARRVVRHTGRVVRLERKRWEPPTGNHWFEVYDGELTGFATMGRRRADRVVAVLAEAGFSVERR